jgi:hypothetical protein
MLNGFDFIKTKTVPVIFMKWIFMIDRRSETRQQGRPAAVKNIIYKVHCFLSLVTTVDTIVSKRPKINAQRKLSILIPETNLSANRMMITLITRRKRPNVIMVIGRVKMTRSGLTRKLRTASTNAKIIAVVNEFITTCGLSSSDNAKTATAVMRILMTQRINMILLKLH